MDQYLRLCLLAFATFSGLLLPLVPFHELGHKLVCEALGGKGEITAFNNARCLGGSNDQLMWFAGGAFGTMGAMVPWIFWRKWKKSMAYRGVIIGTSAFAVLEFQKGVWEAIDYQFYVSNFAEQTFLMIALVVSVMMLAILRPKPTPNVT